METALEGKIERLTTVLENHNTAINEIRNQLTIHIAVCKTSQCRIGDIPDAIDRIEKHIDRAFNGNGGPGLKLRIDRLEQVEKGRRWTIRTLAATVIGVVAVAIVDFFHK